VRLRPALDGLDADLLVLMETRDNFGTRLMLDSYREKVGTGRVYCRENPELQQYVCCEGASE
jgi:hypothetical protein